MNPHDVWVGMNASTEHKQATTGFETIFVAVSGTDGDRVDRLAEEAISMAGPSGARIVLGHVFTRDEYTADRDALDFDPQAEVNPDVVARRLDTIRAIGDRLDDAGIEYEVRGALADSSDGISELAAEEAADMLIVGGRKRSPTGKAVFGSTAQDVMLSAHCPVTFVRNDSE